MLYLAQLEENIIFRLVQLEEKLEEYRKLHADELDGLERGLMELRQRVEALQAVSIPTPDEPTLGEPPSSPTEGG